MNPRVLIIDSDPSRFSQARNIFRTLKVDLFFLDNLEDALQMLRSESCDVIIVREDMTGLNSRRILTFIKEGNISASVIVLSSFSSSERAKEMIDLGAVEYIAHDRYTEALAHSVQNLLDFRDLKIRSRLLEQALAEPYSFSRIVGKSAKMREIFSLIKKVAPSNANILLEGESGTGKELVARAIHYNSDRRGKSFVAINCAAIPRDLIESELFGHIRGAFTGAEKNKVGLFEEATGGTILLDEISEIPLELQSKLLRALQEKEIKPVGSARSIPIDIRLITASNRELYELVNSGLFREDLYYRINTIVISLPPLRERREDIPILVDHFIGKYGQEIGKKILGVDDEALTILINHHWPGNVRELENAIERAVILAENDFLFREDFNPGGNQSGLPQSEQYKEEFFNLEYNRAKSALLDDFAANYITRLLIKHKGNVTRAAAEAGIKRQSLHQMISRLGLKINRYR